MRQTVVLLLSAAFLATLPSIASAKKAKPRQAAGPVYSDENAGSRLVADALHQFIVPLEVTFTPRRY
jgi:hypothetical protein